MGAVCAIGHIVITIEKLDYEHRLVHYAVLILEYLQNNGWRAERQKIKEWIHFYDGQALK